MKKIGFIGIGVMGNSMAQNLMHSGYQLTVYSRTKSKAEPLIAQGAIWKNNAAQCAAGQDAVITMVGYPKDVEEVYFGENGIFSGIAAGSYVIDMTTTSPKLSKRIYETAKELGVFALDAPVSGGDMGAKNGTLSIMVGGDEDAFLQCMPLFSAMGTNIIYEGTAGSGQHTKMANQIALGGCIAGVCEAIRYAQSEGLDVEKMLASISKGAAGSWQMTYMAPRMLAGDFAPGFFIKHYIKDMKIAMEEAQNSGLNLKVLETVLEMYRTLEEKGFGNEGTQALLKYYK